MLIGILVIFNGDDPQDLANQLVKNGKWMDNIVYSASLGKSSSSGSFSSDISRSGNFYFGGYATAGSKTGGKFSNHLHQGLSLLEIGRSSTVVAVSPVSESPTLSHPETSPFASSTSSPSASILASSTPPTPSTQNEPKATSGTTSQSTRNGESQSSGAPVVNGGSLPGQAGIPIKLS
ncbi:hypothetical protein VKT23_013954 [Stygiomarasmius scandens]|uniref:Uncharacterized protein n=1 Tax=Marasmiellus scandens TaxID=2682957 RepID=A0ABR1J6A7_9AGAR